VPLWKRADVLGGVAIAVIILCLAIGVTTTEGRAVRGTSPLSWDLQRRTAAVDLRSRKAIALLKRAGET